MLSFAYLFAAEKHKNQRRKDSSSTPYINHPIQVADLLVKSGVTDENVIIAGLLHDTIEDVGVTVDEIKTNFNETIANIVAECTDVKSLNKVQRKRLQVQHAATISKEAKLVKLADKYSNLSNLLVDPPKNWSKTIVEGYAYWCLAVIRVLLSKNKGEEINYFDCLFKTLYKCDIVPKHYIYNGMSAKYLRECYDNNPKFDIDFNINQKELDLKVEEYYELLIREKDPKLGLDKYTFGELVNMLNIGNVECNIKLKEKKYIAMDGQGCCHILDYFNKHIDENFYDICKTDVIYSYYLLDIYKLIEKGKITVKNFVLEFYEIINKERNPPLQILKNEKDVNDESEDEMEYEIEEIEDKKKNKKKNIPFLNIFTNEIKPVNQGVAYSANSFDLFKSRT